MEKTRWRGALFRSELLFFSNFRRSERSCKNARRSRWRKREAPGAHKQRAERSLPTQNNLKKAPLTAKNAFGVIGALAGNTSGVSKSSSDWLNYTGFPGDVCVAFFNVPPGNKNAMAPNPLTKEESRRVYKCDDERLSGSTKRWIFKSMWKM